MDKDVKAIIERLEAASGPDREIDGAIALCINPEAKLWTPEWWSGGRDEYLLWPDPKPGVARYEQVEHYTSSIDAALSLVPEGCAWLIGSTKMPGFPPCEMDIYEGRDFIIGNATAPTPALAIVLAALRARAHKGEK